MKQQSLPLGDDVAAHVDIDEARTDFERRRWRGQPAEKSRQGLMFEHIDDAPDQTYLFGD